MKIAVPFEDGQVFQHFGRSAQFKFYEAENGQLLRTEVCLLYTSPSPRDTR